jgi:hypothetical protein
MKKLTGLQIFAIAIATFFVAFAICLFIEPYGLDWEETFHPALYNYLTVNDFDLYDGTGYYNPPWLVWAVMPFLLLSKSDGRAAWFGFSAACYVVFALRSGFRPVPLLAFLCSPIVLVSLWYGNVDGVVLLGAVLPPFIGIPLLAIKPQIGFVLILFYAFESLYVNRDVNQFVNRFFLLYIFGVLSIINHGAWFLNAFGSSPPANNGSLWLGGPLNIVLALACGVFLTVSAARKLNPDFALAAAPFLAPYTQFYSLPGALILLKKKPLWSVVVLALTWGVILYLATQQSG